MTFVTKNITFISRILKHQFLSFVNVFLSYISVTWTQSIKHLSVLVNQFFVRIVTRRGKEVVEGAVLKIFYKIDCQPSLAKKIIAWLHLLMDTSELVLRLVISRNSLYYRTFFLSVKTLKGYLIHTDDPIETSTL